MDASKEEIDIGLLDAYGQTRSPWFYITCQCNLNSSVFRQEIAWTLVHGIESSRFLFLGVQNQLKQAMVILKDKSHFPELKVCDLQIEYKCCRFGRNRYTDKQIYFQDLLTVMHLVSYCMVFYGIHQGNKHSGLRQKRLRV